MGLVYADRVKQLTATTGLDDFQLGVFGAGFTTFALGIGTGNSCYYTVESVDKSEWEVGIGTVVAGTPDVITRDQVLSSSTGSKVSFSAGDKAIYCSPAAALFSRLSNGVELVNLTAAQRDALAAPPEGLVIYNSTSRLLNVYNGSGWEYIASSPTIIASGTFAPPSGNVSTAYFYDASVLFTGGTPTSYALATGSLPAGVTFNTATGVFSGTPTTSETVAGVSVSATNAGGTATTNAADIVIWAAVNTVAPPTPYYGHTKINTTNLAATIGFIEDPNNQEAPVSVAAYANITIEGTRALTSKPLNGYEHCHTVWTLTKGDGTAISETHDGIYNYRYNPTTKVVEGTLVNVHTDTISPEFTDLMLNHGAYKLTLEVYAMTNTGQCRKASSEYSFTVAKPTNNHIYIDPVGGLDTNDGLHPLLLPVPSGGWNLNYVESTGILSQTGAFTGLVLDAEPYDTDTANFIHLTGFGRARIAEVIDANSVRIDDRWKLGSDQTGLTSSNGPKQSIVTNAANNTVYHYIVPVGGLDLPAPISMDTKSGHCGVYACGAGLDRRIFSSTIAPGTSSSHLILMASPSSSASSPDKCMVSRFELDSQETLSVPIRSGIGNINPAKKFRQIYRRLKPTRSAAGSILDPGTPKDGAGSDMLFWGNELDNLAFGTQVKTIGMLISTNPRSTLRCIGNISDSDVVDTVEDPNRVSSGRYHHWYFSGWSDHLHLGWNYFRNGYGANYCVNTDCTEDLGEWTRYGMSYHDNFYGAAIRAVDFSNHTNVDVNYFDNIYMARCQSNLEQDFYYPSTAISSFVVACDHNATLPEGTSAFFRHNDGMLSTYDHVIERCRNYGPMIYNAGAQTPTLEAFNNESVNDRADTIFQIRGFQPSLSESTFTDNKFYSPNSVDGNVYQIEGVTTNLAALNALTNSTGNTEQVIAWADWPPTSLNVIAFSNAVANGASGTTTSTEITLTFDEDPVGLAATDITVTGATKGALSGTGTTRTLAISNITVLDSATVNVAIADNNGNTFGPASRDVTVYKSSINANKFTTPQDFSSWVNNNLGVTVDTTTAPDSTLTADTLSEGTANSEHARRQTPATTGASEVISVYAKYVNAKYVGFRLNIAGSWRNLVFDIELGTVFDSTGATSAAITLEANGFYRCSAVIPNRTQTTIGVSIFSADGLSHSYLGTSRTFVAWGAKLEDGDTLTAYVPS